MAFVLHFSIFYNPFSNSTRGYVFQRLLETIDYSLNEHEETKFDFFCNSWKYFICFFVLEYIFSQIRFKFLLPFGTERLGLWSMNLDTLFQCFVLFFVKTCKEITYNICHICKIIEIQSFSSQLNENVIDYQLISAKVIPKQCPCAILSIIWVEFSGVYFEVQGRE